MNTFSYPNINSTATDSQGDSDPWRKKDIPLLINQWDDDPDLIDFINMYELVFLNGFNLISSLSTTCT